jgi:peptide/nickel transport system permease protein
MEKSKRSLTPGFRFQPARPAETTPARRTSRSRPIVMWLGLLLLAPVVLAALAAPWLAPFDPWAAAGPALQAPSGQYWLGTDDLGRDLLSLIIYGARTSLVVGLSVALLALSIGGLVGLVSGYAGGWADDFLMRLTELFQVLPRFFLALVVIALFGNSLNNLILVLALTSWSGLARLARAEVLSLREREFVVGARTVGVKPLRILARHILPNAIGPLVASAALVVSAAILTEAGLSFLGLGDPNAISWGYLLNNAQPFLRRAWWLPLFPGLTIVITVLGVSLSLEALTRSERS